MKSGMIAAETINEHIKRKKIYQFMKINLKKVGYIKNYMKQEM